MFGKKSSEKSEKNVLLYSHKFRYQKMGGKNARNNFSRNTIIVRSKNGKKIVGKNCENLFLNSHDDLDQKIGGKNARNNFSRNTLLVLAKNVWKKIVGKKCEKRFFIFTRIS